MSGGGYLFAGELESELVPRGERGRDHEKKKKKERGGFQGAAEGAEKVGDAVGEEGRRKSSPLS